MGDKDRAVIKEVMKKGKARLMERQLAWSRVAQWQARLEALEPGVQQLLQVSSGCVVEAGTFRLPVDCRLMV